MKNSATGDFLSVEKIEKMFVVTTSTSNIGWNWIPSDGSRPGPYVYNDFGSRGVWGYIHHSDAGYLTTDTCADSDPVQVHDQNLCTLKFMKEKHWKVEKRAAQLWRRWNNKIISMNLYQSKVSVPNVIFLQAPEFSGS